MVLKREDCSNWNTLLYSPIVWDTSFCPCNRLRCSIGLSQKRRRAGVIYLGTNMTALCRSIAFEDSNSDRWRKLNRWGSYFFHHVGWIVVDERLILAWCSVLWTPLPLQHIHAHAVFVIAVLQEPWIERCMHFCCHASCAESTCSLQRCLSCK